MERIIAGSTACRLAMVDGDQPYVVPLCFGYRDNLLYIHSASAGRKIDILKRNNRVCFVFDIEGEIIKKADQACSWSMKYKSVIGFGKASFIQDPQEKRKALDCIMRQYAEGSFVYAEEKIDKIVVIRIDIEQMTGKQSR